MKPQVKFIIVSGSITKHIRLYSLPINQKDAEKAMASRKKIIDVLSFSLN